jgi:two-component system, sensor histidine kinase and response regulator
VPIHKWLFSPISVLGGNFNPRNITYMPAVKISARLKLDENISFLDGHQLGTMDQSERDRVDRITAVVHYLLKGEQVSQIDCAGDPDDEIKQLAGKVNALIDLFLDISSAIKPLALGKLDGELKSRILFLAPFKQLQANLRHLTWQTQQIAQGNFNLRVDFMGDFSEAFNSMVASLARAQKATEAAQQAKSRFLANMSHEIRTPMNAIIGFVDLARNESEPEKRNEYLSLAATSGDHLLAIINDILDFSKAEAGELVLEAIDFDLHQMVRETMRMVDQKAVDKGLETFCTIDSDINFYTEGDPTRLRQILINLLGNAIKFTDHGSIGVRVTLVEDWGEKKLIQFSVEDTGIGIPEDKHDKVFESFSQADAATTRMYGGTGLGLAICKTYIEKMDGIIWVESVAGKGSSFLFKIPFKAKESIACQPIQPIARKGLAGKTALILDDDSKARHLARTFCTDVGMKIVGALSFSDWRDDDTRRKPYGPNVDVILLGVRSVDMRPLEAVVREIKAAESRKQAKIIMMCSDPQKGDAQSAREKNIDAYIPKPILKDALVDVIATALGDSRSCGPIATRHMANELSCKGMHILLAEDNPVNVRLMEILLRNLGCSFDTVPDGQAACSAVKSKKYDVVLMDVFMPVMNGLDATKSIRAETNHQVPIIALTAAAMREEQAKCYASGMDDILLKPINVNELKEKLYTWGKLKE